MGCERRNMTEGESQGEIITSGGVQEGRGEGCPLTDLYRAGVVPRSSQAGKTSQRQCKNCSVSIVSLPKLHLSQLQLQSPQ